MSIHEIQAKSLLRKQKTVDSWFISRYGVNLYRGCHHNCSYCDGRAETYNVDGDFVKDISVKTNAIELLNRELNPKRKRKPMSRSYIVMSGGVNDCYQPIEKQYQLSRKALETIEQWNFPVHVLTKSTLVERDIDLLKKIHQKQGVLVSFSLSTTDDALAKHFEPNVPSPTLRLKTLEYIANEGIPTGVFLMPVIPLLSDTKEHLTKTLKVIKAAGAKYVIFGSMTLKPGRQREHFYEVAQTFDPKLVKKYQKMYGADKWGNAIDRYYPYVHNNFKEALQQHPLPIRIPAQYFQHILSPFDFTLVILSQINYLLKHNSQPQRYSSAVKLLYRNYRELEFASKKEVRTRLEKLYDDVIEICLNCEIPEIYSSLLLSM